MLSRYLSEQWFRTEIDVLLADGSPPPEGINLEVMREEWRQRLRPQIEWTLTLLEAGVDDDTAVEAVMELWVALGDLGRREFLRWCYCHMRYIGRRPFSRVLAMTWGRPKTTSLHGWGFPYRDLVEMFDRTVPDLVMEAEDLALFNVLPDEFTAFRGVGGVTVAQAKRGMSWTLDRDRAEWFAQRNSDRGAPMLLTATIRKPNVLAVYRDPEQEIVVRSGQVSRVTSVALPSE